MRRRPVHRTKAETSESNVSADAVLTTDTAQTRADAIVELCNNYLALEARREHLLVLSGDVEATLADNYNWFSLTRVQRRAVSEAKALYDIDDELEQICQTTSQLIQKLGRMRAQNVFGAIAKLEVVAQEIESDDYPPAHAVLRGAISDLRRLFSPGD
ncbi:MAG: hypothetical protein GC155_08325 [Alphaproteobacteria bacterium]|nr:hypothetical protein [Alphaproteobacteria bacterium]